ncbi:MAG TPA: YhbY family RNA-binding protein [Opitutaceae bacterium]|nr:YhbY family RNA-binding protein [Opitutaceae bacterium]
MTAPALTGAQKSFLRSLGQTMDCQLTIGREGITAPVVAELEKLFARHELIKVKLLAERDERSALCTAIEDKTGAAEAGAVGKTAIFYRQAANPEKRTIELPAPKAKPAV